ncbi:transcriptional regulator [Streptomyces avidinii]|uniref:tetratricopeptide repeat protein n=1 Tax=Streptomyces avidinii TaxID=1895 RepID=UPI00386DF965|nr:transcriptional regulator [Streptomyces avidinii]WST50059.1 transcriptional regulator [Streptomyces avidinii]
MAAVARAVGLGKEVRSLLDLLAAASGATRGPEGELGKLIAAWDPLALEVHPAVDIRPATQGEEQVALLPGYVARAHDAKLAGIVAAAADGASQMAVLVGSSSTGKTRTCWEAVQALAPLGWRLWHPFDPTRAEAAMAALERVGPRTVVWLNEAQHYLGAGQGLGERIAAAIRSLLTDPDRGPVLVLGTLWPQYATAFAALPEPGQADPHAQVREILAGRWITLPESFDIAATDATRVLASAGDRQLAHALEHAKDGRLTQYLAGAPELLHRYEIAPPPARALLHAAMDARRLGVGLHLPMAFLEDAAVDYLTDDEYDLLADNWLEQAIADTSTPVHGNLAPLRRIRPRPDNPEAAPLQTSYRLADYLEQHGSHQRRLLCPPASFWRAAHQHLATPADLTALGQAAHDRYRIRYAYLLWKKAADDSSPVALARLGRLHHTMGDLWTAERLLRQAAEAGDTDGMIALADLLDQFGNVDEAMSVAMRATSSGDDSGALWLALRNKDFEKQRAIYLQAAAAGSTLALRCLGSLLRRYGDQAKAHEAYQQAADAGDPDGFTDLGKMQEEAGNDSGAVALFHKAASAGSPDALLGLARTHERAGNHREADEYTHQAATAGAPNAFHSLSRMRYNAGMHAEALRTAQQSLAFGTAQLNALGGLAFLLEKAGDHTGAEQLNQLALDAGYTNALVSRARTLEAAGNKPGAEAAARQAADAGNRGGIDAINELRHPETQGWYTKLWPDGLEPNGTPSQPWRLHTHW